MSSLIPWVGGQGAIDPFAADLWDPLGGSSLLWETGRRGDDTSTLARTSVDWRETETAHIFTAELPGVRKEEVKVEVEEGNVLRISGERTKVEEDKGDTWHRVERRRGSFSRRFRLPENANMDEIKGSLDHGVLTVTVPKKETARSRNVKSIDIS
ncbi:16.9 kDa class I heat shock protein 1-like [Typha latifolia]|uniref:16.9 kDa class I heat shock protein 1-like n=1 Tax=Typha latifolia TaxID=4733 RepID=UPI003C2FABBF